MPSNPPPMTTARAPGGSRLQGAHIGEVAEGDDAGEIGAGDGQADGAWSRSPAPAGRSRAARRSRAPPRAGGPQCRGFASPQTSSMPFSASQEAGRSSMSAALGLAGQQARQQHAVIGRVRFLGDQHDIVAAGADARRVSSISLSAAMPPPTMTRRSRERLATMAVIGGLRSRGEWRMASGEWTLHRRLAIHWPFAIGHSPGRVGSSLRSTQPTIRAAEQRSPWRPAWRRPRRWRLRPASPPSAWCRRRPRRP